MAVRAYEFDVQDATVRVMNFRNLRKIDWLLPLLVLLLAGIGWALIYSATRSTDHSRFSKQIVFFFMGLAVAMTIICIDYRFLVAMAPLAYVVSILLLVGIFFFAETTKGSERWYNFGPIKFQPSETAKLVMVYTLTWYLTTIGDRVKKLPWFLITFVITGIPMALILKQPNLGTAATLGPLTLAMLFVSGCRIRHLAVICLGGLSLIPLLWWQIHDFDPNETPKTEAYYEMHPEEKPAPRPFYELRHHQKKRIYTFLHPETDLQNSGWQTYQSKITVGSGGMFGKGYLQGTQTRLNYLPEHDTDFIYSLLAEEHGFVGAVVVIALFAVFLLRALSYARDCPELMGALLASGIVTVLAVHIFVNIAITIGLLPVTGIPLPFLSYGGSFYLTTMACVGVLLNVPMRRRVYVN